MRRLPLAPPGKVRTHRDPGMPGLYLRCTDRVKSWMAQRTVGGRCQRAYLGHYPVVRVAEAREAAREALLAIGQGRILAEERRRERTRSLTLAEALDTHLRTRSLSPVTAKGYRDMIETYLRDWLTRELRHIGEDRPGVAARHEKLTTDHGPHLANGVLRTFRALYRNARRLDPDLPECPTVAVHFHRTPKRKVDLGTEVLRAWGRTVLTLSPVRRDLHVFMLLTGMRRTATLTARAADLHLRDGYLHVPNPKGGEERAFDLPLSGPLLDLLRHRIAENEILARGTPWIFPSPSATTGHVAEVKEPALGGLCGHALRHAYRTLSEEAGISWGHSKLLLNHAVQDVTFTYTQRRIEALREAQERVSAHVLATVGLTWRPGTWPPTVVEQ